LEAMASGVPVACARACSLPETAGNAALYFDPLDASDMAECILTLTTNLGIRKECSKQGLVQAKKFSWDACTSRTLEIIQETAS